MSRQRGDPKPDLTPGEWAQIAPHYEPGKKGRGLRDATRRLNELRGAYRLLTKEARDRATVSVEWMRQQIASVKKSLAASQNREASTNPFDVDGRGTVHQTDGSGGPATRKETPRDSFAGPEGKDEPAQDDQERGT